MSTPERIDQPVASVGRCDADALCDEPADVAPEATWLRAGRAGHSAAVRRGRVA